MPRRKRAFELLEDRRLLTANDPFAILQGALLAPGVSAQIGISVRAQDFSFSGQDTLLRFRLSGNPESQFDPAVVGLAPAAGSPLIPVASHDNDSAGYADAIFRVSAGTYQITATGEGTNTGGFEIAVSLVGDLDGNFTVDQSDTLLWAQNATTTPTAYLGDFNLNGTVDAADFVIWRKNQNITSGALPTQGDSEGDGDVDAVDYGLWRGNYGTVSVANPSPNPLAGDADGDGDTDFADLQLLRDNLGAATSLRPLTLTVDNPSLVYFAPSGAFVTNSASLTFAGHSLPNQTIQIDNDGDLDFNDATSPTGPTGSFSVAVPLNVGTGTIRFQVADAFGQVRNSSLQITRDPLFHGEPLVHATLQNDTGRLSTDRVTNNASVMGAIYADESIVALRAGVDTTNEASFVDVTPQLNGNQFTLPTSVLETINGGPLADGVHTLRIQAQGAIDGWSRAFELQFTLDTTAPSATQLGLAVTSDSGILGDQTTNAGRVTLTGTSENGATIVIAAGGLSALASNAGTFQFPGVGLTVGANPFTVDATDLAGNTFQFNTTIHRVVESQNQDPVLRWNQALLEAVRLDATAPPAASRGMAMVHGAIYDAVASIEGLPGFFVALAEPAGVSAEAAVAGAAHEVLSYLYPGQQAYLDSVLAASLAQVPDGASETDGVDFGRSVGDAIIALRSNDGWNDFVDYVPDSGPGVWNPTTPLYAPALLPQWADLTPFAMTSPDQFLPAGPPDLTSQAYADAFNEVKALGKIDSATRTAEQTQIARFWADGSGTYTPPGHWNKIAEQAATQVGNSLLDNARLFAQLNVALADAAIVAWNAKYTYESWRPVTAIQEGATDGNANTTADATWQPLLITPPFPEYISGHSTFSGAAAAVLTDAFGNNFSFSTDSFGLPGVTRSFASFEAAAQEAGQSRIYGGIHFQFANQDGLAAGASLAAHVLDAFAATTDVLPPTITITSPPADSVDSQNITVTGRVLDNLAGVASLVAQVDGGAFAAVTFDAQGNFNLPTTFALNGTADGVHTLRFRGTDFEGNVSPLTEFSFTLDTLAPALTVTTPAEAAVLTSTTRLTGTVGATGSTLTSLTYAFDGGPAMPFLPSPNGGAFDVPLDLMHLSTGVHTLTVIARDAAGNVTTVVRNVSLAAPIPLTVVDFTPLNGANDVGSTYRPQVFFSRPIDTATLTANNFYATDTTGAKVPATIVPAADGTFAWLFFTNPLPSASTITMHVVGSSILAVADGQALDGDGDGTAGGTLTYQFSTVSLTPLANTSLTGKVLDPGVDLKPMTFDDIRAGADGALHTADDVFLSPIAGVKVYILGMESHAVYTDAQGNFTLPSVPSGNVKLALDGRTATNAPVGVYFPEMVMDLELEVGQVNTVMGTMGQQDQRNANLDRPEVYLPRLETSILQTVSDTVMTTIGVDAESAPNLTEEQRQFLQLQVAPGTLIGDDGQVITNGQIGISTVPPELVRDMLPPGVLQHTFDITIQAPTAAAFSEPLQIAFPNVFNADPGTKLNFLSFDHTTGRLVIEGTATVSADGKSVTTDPGTGITKPGWHGVTVPGSDSRTRKKDDPPVPCDVFSIVELSDIGALVKFGAEFIAKYYTGLKEALCGIDALVELGIASKKVADLSQEPLGPTCQTVRIAIIAIDALVNTYEDCFKSDIRTLGNLVSRLQGALDRTNQILPKCTMLSPTSVQWINSLTQMISVATPVLSRLTGYLSDQDAVHLLANVLKTKLESLCTASMAPTSGTSNSGSSSLLSDNTPITLDAESLDAIHNFLTAASDTHASASQLDASELTSLATLASQSADLNGQDGGSFVIAYELAGNNRSSKHLFYKVTNLDTGAIIQGQTNSIGAIDQLFLASNTVFKIDYLDPTTFYIGSAVFKAGISGSSTLVPVVTLASEELAVDSDHDGMSDYAEGIVGTDATRFSTSGDGISDSQKLSQGLNSFGTRPFATGLVASLPLAGEANEVVLVGSTLNPGQQTAFVATGNYGLAILNGSQFQNPLLLSQFDLVGDSTDVALDPIVRIAAVASNSGGLHLINVADPTQPVLLQTLNAQANQVEIIDGVVYASIGGELRSYDILTGERIQTLSLGGSGVTSMAREGAFLYTVDVANTLRTIEVTANVMTARGTLSLPAGGGKLFVGGGVAYVGAGAGFATVDVSNPNTLALISGVDAANIQGRAVVANGSGIAITVGNVLGPSGPIYSLDVLNVADPGNTANFITRYNLPAPPESVAIGAGIAFIADGTGGLQIVNYRAFDNLGVPPTVSVTSAITDIDPGTPGIQVQEGSTIAVKPTITDDVQVRNVELLVNGQVVLNDVSFPFDLSTILPTIAANGSNTVSVTVRATDTGGNATTSTPIDLLLVADAVAPTIVSNTAVNGSLRSQSNRTVTVTFSEAIDTAAVNSANFVLNGPGGVVAPENIQLRYEDRQVHITYPTLAVGAHQFTIHSSAVLDRGGNALGATDVVSNFDVDVASAKWINPAGGFWDVASNWSTGVVPGPDDDVLIDVPGGVTITYRQDITEIHSLHSTNPFVLSGGALNVYGTVQIDNTFTMSGGAVLGYATVLPGSGGQGVTVNGSAELDGVRMDANVDVLSQNHELRISNGMILNGTVHIGDPGGATKANIRFMNSQTVGGSGEILLGPSPDNQLYATVSGLTVTIGPDLTIRGVGKFFDGTTWVNQGTISADFFPGTLKIEGPFINQGTLAAVNNASLQVNSANWSNTGTIAASGGNLQLGSTVNAFAEWTSTGVISVTNGTLNTAGTWSHSGELDAINSTVTLDGSYTEVGTISRNGGAFTFRGLWDNTGKTATLDGASGTWDFRRTTVVGGTIQFTGGAKMLVKEFVELYGVQIDGDIDVTDASTELRVGDGPIFNGTVRVGATNGASSSSIRFINNQMIGGTGEIILGPNANNRLHTNGQTRTITIAAGLTIRGTGQISEATYINQGTISADNATGTLTINAPIYTNQGLTQAINGAILDLTAASWGGAGTFAETNSFLYLGATGNTGTTTGPVNLNGGVAEFNGNWSNTGLITNTNANLLFTGNYSQIGPMMRTGGVVRLRRNWDNTGKTTVLDANTGSWNLEGEFAGAPAMTLTGGVVSSTGGYGLIVNGAAEFYSAQVDTNVDVTQNNAELRLFNGATLNGTVSVGNAAGTTVGQLTFRNTQTIGGSGQIVLGPNSNNRLHMNGQSHTVTFGPNLTIRGIGQLNDGTYINQGTISADNANGTLRVNSANITNVGVLSAVNLGTLNLNGVSGPHSGTIKIEAGSLINFTGNLVQSPTGTIRIDIEGTSGGQFGKLLVSGSAALDGALTAAFTNAYSPNAGDSFNVLDYASHTGTFATISTLNLPGDLVATPSYGSTDFNLSTAAAGQAAFISSLLDPTPTTLARQDTNVANFATVQLIVTQALIAVDRTTFMGATTLPRRTKSAPHIGHFFAGKSGPLRNVAPTVRDFMPPRHRAEPHVVNMLAAEPTAADDAIESVWAQRYASSSVRNFSELNLRKLSTESVDNVVDPTDQAIERLFC